MSEIDEHLEERHTISGHINISQTELLQKYPDTGADLWSAAKTAHLERQSLETLRALIKRDVGDTSSLLGTTADGAQLSIAVLMALISAVDGNGTYASFKTAFLGTLASLAGNDHATGNPVDIPAMANTFLGDLGSGDIKLTAVMKGVPAVINEISQRATGVTDILLAAAAQQQNS